MTHLAPYTLPLCKNPVDIGSGLGACGMGKTSPLVKTKLNLPSKLQESANLFPITNPPSLGWHDLPKYLLFFIVPTFDTKVREYLCSGWVFFSDKIRLFN